MKMPDRQHDAFAELVDQPAAERAGDQPHQGERRDHGADLEVAHPEAAGEHRQHRHQDAEPDGDAESDQAEHEDIARESSGCRGSRSRTPPVCSPAQSAACAFGVHLAA